MSRIIIILNSFFLYFGLPQLISLSPSVEFTRTSGYDIGLDSNDVMTGPNMYLLGYRIKNTGDSELTNINLTFTWELGSTGILTPQTSKTTLQLPSLGPEKSADFYFNIEFTRDNSVREATRSYQLSLTADEFLEATTHVDSITCQKIVSQNRNGVVSISIKDHTALVIGREYDFVMQSYTATNGYGDLELILYFPNDKFQILKVLNEFTVGGTSDTIRTAPGYNVGGNSITSTYTVKPLETGTVEITASVSDLSGGSFHYNSNYGETQTTFSVLTSQAGLDISLSTVEADPTTVLANGTSSSIITVTLLEADGTPIEGQSVSLTGTGNSMISDPSGTSDSNGKVMFTVTDMTVEEVTYTANVNDVELTEKAIVHFVNTLPKVDPDMSTVIASPTTVLADGTSSSTITVTLVDSTGNPIEGQSVSLTQTGNSTISAPSGTSDSNGKVTFTVTDMTVEEVTYTANVGAVILTQKPPVDFLAIVNLMDSDIQAQPESVLADGMAYSTITVTLKDDMGNPLPNRQVVLMGMNGNSIINYPDGLTTDQSGQAVFTVTDTSVEIVTYQAVVDGNQYLLKVINVNFYLPLDAPTNFKGTVMRNNFGIQSEIMHILTWTPSPSPDIEGYYIYRNGVLIHTTRAQGPYSYTVRKCCRNTTYTYQLVGFNANETSEPLTITVSS